MAHRKRRRERDRPSGMTVDVDRAVLLEALESRTEAAVWVQEFAPLRTIHASRAYEVIWGRSLDALYANPRDWIDAVHAEDSARVGSAGRLDRVDGVLVNGDDEIRTGRLLARLEVLAAPVAVVTYSGRDPGRAAATAIAGGPATAPEGRDLLWREESAG